MNDRQGANSRKILRGPIRHESLPPELLDQIKSVYDVIGGFLGKTLEQFEIGFMRDIHPEVEIALWINITTAWIDFHKTFLEGEMKSKEDEEDLLCALVAISTGTKEVEKLGVPVEIGRRLLACYLSAGGQMRPITGHSKGRK